MAWNEPGKPGDKDPWGQRRKSGAGGPDIDRIVKDIQQKFAGLFGGLFGGRGGSGGGTHASGFGFGLILVVALVIWLATGFYVVNQSERGVVLHFGRKDEVTGPGLHWHLPWPIERVEKVNVDQVSTLWIGKRDKSLGADSGFMLTQDENIVVVEFSVQYKIKDASDYLFNVRDPVSTIVQAMESASREVVGKNQLDFIMTEGQLEVADKTQKLLQEILDRYKSGVQIVKVQMQRVSPPDEVKSAFDDATKAREDGARVIKEAEAYSNDILPRARGAAARLIQEAEGYKASVIVRADGDARRFSQIANEYVKAPNVTRERLYLETMEQVLSSTTTIFIDQKAGNNLIYLPLDKLVPLGEAVATPPAAPPLTEAEAVSRGGVTGRGRADLRSRGVTP